jgi:hypothetical protein
MAPPGCRLAVGCHQARTVAAAHCCYQPANDNGQNTRKITVYSYSSQHSSQNRAPDELLVGRGRQGYLAAQPAGKPQAVDTCNTYV